MRPARLVFDDVLIYLSVCLCIWRIYPCIHSPIQAFELLQFGDVMKGVLSELLPNRLCELLKEVSERE